MESHTELYPFTLLLYMLYPIETEEDMSSQDKCLFTQYLGSAYNLHNISSPTNSYSVHVNLLCVKEHW